jgi:hypothetical protein
MFAPGYPVVRWRFCRPWAYFPRISFWNQKQTVVIILLSTFSQHMPAATHPCSSNPRLMIPLGKLANCLHHPRSRILGTRTLHCFSRMSYSLAGTQLTTIFPMLVTDAASHDKFSARVTMKGESLVINRQNSLLSRELPSLCHALIFILRHGCNKN